VTVWILPALPAHKREALPAPPSPHTTGALFKQGSQALHTPGDQPSPSRVLPGLPVARDGTPASSVRHRLSRIRSCGLPIIFFSLLPGTEHGQR
jgi:hypothetical protein